jgi:hypothetical protein
MSERFYIELKKSQKKSKNTINLSNEKYQQILNELLQLKDGKKKKKTSRDYWILQRY